MEKKYPIVVIIGNGFDLNLGLKTSYQHFINSDEFNNLSLNNLFAGHLKMRNDIQKWIDVECELKTYSKAGKHNNYANFEEEYMAVASSLMMYLGKIDYSEINKESQAFDLIKTIKDQDFLIIDFNYTNTISILLKEFGFSNAEIAERIIKIHGSVDEGEIIFGVEDGAENITREHVFLRKAYRSKGINVSSILESSDTIFIFGHSMGSTDHTYFRHFFNIYSEYTPARLKKNITLYHFSNLGKIQLHMELDILTDFRPTVFKTVNTVHLIDASIQL